MTKLSADPAAPEAAPRRSQRRSAPSLAIARKIAAFAGVPAVGMLVITAQLLEADTVRIRPGISAQPAKHADVQAFNHASVPAPLRVAPAAVRKLELSKVDRDDAGPLKRSLGSDLSYVRAAAASTLFDRPELARACRAELGAALSDGEPIVRLHAARTLCQIEQCPEALAELKALIRSENPGVRRLSIYHLGSLGPTASEALPELRALLTTSDPQVRIDAAEAVVRVDGTDAAAVSVLLQALISPHPEYRVQAAMLEREERWLWIFGRYTAAIWIMLVGMGAMYALVAGWSRDQPTKVYFSIGIMLMILFFGGAVQLVAGFISRARLGIVKDIKGLELRVIELEGLLRDGNR